MKNVLIIGKWITQNFFPISIAVFGVIYLNWFRLTPLMLNGSNDSDDAYVFGFGLLTIYSVSGLLVKLSKRNFPLKMFLLIPMVVLFSLNIVYLKFFFPRVTNNLACNGTMYYITWSHPLSDPQWSNYTLAKWKNAFTYQTQFFGYPPGAGPFEIVCDDEKGETNIVRTINNVLVYTDGANPRRYDAYAGTQLNDQQYFLAWQCNNWSPYTCGSETYTLYQCNLDFKSCDSLPLHYTVEDPSSYLVLEADNKTNEISLYDDYEDNPDRTLIFTWSENPRCYVEGCEVLEK